MNCPHKRDGLCQISTSLAGLPVLLADDACAACSMQTNPQAVNRVTCSKAIQARRLAGLIPTDELLACVNPPKAGVGTELERLIDRTRSFLATLRLDWIIPTGQKCGCNAARNRLNMDGPQSCIANRRAHATEILERWQAHLPLVRYLPMATWLIEKYITHAALNTQRKESAQ